MPTTDDSAAPLEMAPLLTAIYDRYGFDFRDYALASLRRRIRRRMEAEQLSSVAELQAALLAHPDLMERLLLDFSINVSGLFRDPPFFLCLRQKVVPLLQTYPFARCWIAGCSAGEEVYSLAILLREEGLTERTRIYATDFNEAVVQKAKTGIFPIDRMRTYTANYQQAGGTDAFAEYYTAAHGSVRFDPSLTRNVIFAQHNLATDASFNDFHVILCRNVMIYFNSTLQDRVHDLLYDSLVPRGILGLGAKESLKFKAHEADFEPLDESQKLYRRKT